MSQHRASRASGVSRARRGSSTTTGGSHRAEVPTGSAASTPAALVRRRFVTTGLAAAGATALAVAAVGSVSGAQAGAPTHSLTLSASAVRSGESSGYALSPERTSRAKAISRDSERQAQQDMAQEKLQSAVEAQAQQRSTVLSNLARSAEKQAGQIAKNQWHLPTVGYHLTARFGQAGGLWSSNHTGLDFAAPTGTPIFAVANGTITETGWAGSYGNRTVETLEDGTELWYAHQSEIGVKPGQKVISGQQIGRIGATGNVTGPHVHLEVRPGGGDPVDPYTALIYHGLQP